MMELIHLQQALIVLLEMTYTYQTVETIQLAMEQLISHMRLFKKLMTQLTVRQILT